MLSHAVLAILLLQYVNASNCPTGYDSQFGDLCYKAYQGPSNRSEASIHCSKDGGRLASIHDAFRNSMILGLAFKVNADLWIGLICPDTNVKNCVWDDGQVGADQYSAFLKGYPCRNCEHWMHMSYVGDYAGKWLSSGYSFTMGYVCEVSTRDSANNMDLARDSRQH